MTYSVGLFYLTNIVIGLAEVFTCKSYTDELIKSIKYCQSHKGLEIYASAPVNRDGQLRSFNCINAKRTIIIRINSRF
jgi:hypothetical protein